MNEPTAVGPLTTTSAGTRFRWVLDVSLLIVLLAAGVVFTTGLDRVTDLGLYDESRYLGQGLAAPAVWPEAQNAPLYTLWYLVLSWLEADAVELYYLNYAVVTWLPPLALFAALRSHRVRRPAALLLALCLLLCRGNLPVWPKVSHAALVVLLGGLALAALARRSESRAATLAAAALLAAYIRPEMYLGFLILTAVAAWLTWRSVRRSDDGRPWRAAVPFAALLAAALGLALSWGVPLGGERSLAAFGQHYSIHWVRWNDDSRDPWTHWQEIVESDFGELEGMSGPASLLAANPNAVGRHVAANLRSLLATSTRLFGSIHPPSRPALLVPFLGLLLWLLVRRLRRGGGTPATDGSRARPGRRQRLEVASLGTLLLVPGLISVVWISPREHYLLPVGVLAVALLAISLRQPRRRGAPPAVTLLLALLALLLVRPMSTGRGDPLRPQLATVRFLRSLEVSRPLTILEAEGGFHVYLPDGARRVAEYHKDRPFSAFLADRGIDAVVISPRLLRYPALARDPEWRALLANPANAGFVTLSVPAAPGRAVLVRGDVLHRE